MTTLGLLRGFWQPHLALFGSLKRNKSARDARHNKKRGEREQVFAALVPGLRELRSPLACGLVWLFAAYLFTAQVFPQLTANDTPELFTDILDAIKPFGTPGLIAGLTFSAYIIGFVFSVQLASVYVAILGPALFAVRLMRTLGRRFGKFGSILRLAQEADAQFDQANGLMGSLTVTSVSNLRSLNARATLITQVAHDAAIQPVHFSHLLLHSMRSIENTTHQNIDYQTLSWDDVRAHPEAFDQDLRDGFRQAARRLMLKSIEAYNAYDRALAEATFRYALVAPLMALALVLLSYIPGLYDSPTPLSILIAAVTIYGILIAFTFRGLQSTLDATDIMTVAILNDDNTHPLFFAINQEVERRAEVRQEEAQSPAPDRPSKSLMSRVSHRFLNRRKSPVTY